MKKIKKFFTLVELMIAMIILSIIILILMEAFSQAQKAWLASSSTTRVYETARIIFQAVEQDLLSTVASSASGEEIPFAIRADGFPHMVVQREDITANDKSRLVEVTYDVSTIERLDAGDRPTPCFKRGFTSSESASGWDFYGKVGEIKGNLRPNEGNANDMSWTNRAHTPVSNIATGVISAVFEFRTYAYDDSRYVKSENYEIVLMDYYMMPRSKNYNYLPAIVDLEITLYDPISETSTNCPKTKRSFFKRFYLNHGPKRY